MVSWLICLNIRVVIEFFRNLKSHVTTPVMMGLNSPVLFLSQLSPLPVTDETPVTDEKL